MSKETFANLDLIMTASYSTEQEEEVFVLDPPVDALHGCAGGWVCYEGEPPDLGFSQGLACREVAEVALQRSTLGEGIQLGTQLLFAWGSQGAFQTHGHVFVPTICSAPTYFTG